MSILDNEIDTMEENLRLKKEVKKLKEEVAAARPYFKINIERGAIWLGTFLVTAGFLIAAAVWDHVLNPDPPKPVLSHEIDYCYPEKIDYGSVTIRLVAHHIDGNLTIVSAHKDMSDMVKAASLLSCPLLRPNHAEKKKNAPSPAPK